MAKFILAEPQSKGNYVHYLEPRGVQYPHMLGLCTPITQEKDKAYQFDNRKAAEALLPKLNLSPLAKWEVQEVA